MTVIRFVCTFLIFGITCLPLAISAQEVFVDLNSYLDQETFVVEGQAGDLLDEDAGSLDAATLPDSLENDPRVSDTVSFQLQALKADGPDSFLLNSQTLTVPAGNYDALHLALLSLDDFTDLGKMIQLNYADSTSDEVTLGPLSDWIDSPIRFTDQYNQWVDDSNLESYVDIVPQQNDEDYILEIVGGSPNEPRDDYRFIDGSDSLLYEFTLPEDLTTATLRIDILNNFVVELSTDFGNTYTEVLNSQELFDTDVHDGSNRDFYEVDLEPFLQTTPDNIIWVRFTDGTTNNGWGPAVYNIDIFSGESILYELDSVVSMDTSNAEVHVDFRTDGSENEEQYIKDITGTTVSGVDHRFADGSSFVVYELDLPNDINEAKVAVNMEANFVVELSNQFGVETVLDFVPGGDRDQEYIVENTAQDAGSFRFVDGGSSLVYLLDLPDDLTEATLNLQMENNFVVTLDGGDLFAQEELNSFEMFGEDFHDASNLDVYTVELAPYLENNNSNEIYVQFTDGSPSDGWGPAIRNVSVTTGDQPEFTTVLTASDTVTDAVYPYTGTSTYNKKYYTMDITDYLDNSENKVYVKFSDASTDNGWGPGLFRIVAYSGTLSFHHNEQIISGITTTGTDPENAYPWGVNLMKTSFDVDESKMLESITFPEISQDDPIYLYAATLTGTQTNVSDWSLF